MAKCTGPCTSASMVVNVLEMLFCGKVHWAMRHCSKMRWVAICWQQKTGLADSSMTASSHLDPLSSSRSGSGDGDLTGEVGTALYVSPEMMKGGSKLRYDQVSLVTLWLCLSVWCVCECVCPCVCACMHVRECM